MKKGQTQTSYNLRRWHNGDRKGLDNLLRHHLPWIRNHVRKRLGTFLRQKAETGDIVQDAVIEFLRYGPPIVLSDEKQFRALLGRIVENVIRDKYDWFTAKRRLVAKERPLPKDTVLSLGSPGHAANTPSQAAHRNEREAWVRLGLELLNPSERDVVVLREWDGLTFPKIGEGLGISENAARMRFNRSLGRLSETVAALRRGELDEVPESQSSEGGDNG